MLYNAILGLFLGALGQGIRAGIGIAKSIGFTGPTLPPVAIDWARLAITGAIGAAAGIVGALIHPDALFLIACGYAGTDAIEGILKYTGPKA